MNRCHFSVTRSAEVSCRSPAEFPAPLRFPTLPKAPGPPGNPRQPAFLLFCQKKHPQLHWFFHPKQDFHLVLPLHFAHQPRSAPSGHRVRPLPVHRLSPGAHPWRLRLISDPLLPLPVSRVHPSRKCVLHPTKATHCSRSHRLPGSGHAPVPRRTEYGFSASSP